MTTITSVGSINVMVGVVTSFCCHMCRGPGGDMDRGMYFLFCLPHPSSRGIHVLVIMIWYSGVEGGTALARSGPHH